MIKKKNKVLKKIKILNKLGLHARPASLLVEKAFQFDSDIFITKEDLRVNGKSIMGVLMLTASEGSMLTFEAEGVDAKEAIDALEGLINNSFDEKER